MTPTFYYFFIIFLTCYISVPSFIYNLYCYVLLLRNHLKEPYEGKGLSADEFYWLVLKSIISQQLVGFTCQKKEKKNHAACVLLICCLTSVINGNIIEDVAIYNLWWFLVELFYRSFTPLYFRFLVSGKQKKTSARNMTRIRASRPDSLSFTVALFLSCFCYFLFKLVSGMAKTMASLHTFPFSLLPRALSGALIPFPFKRLPRRLVQTFKPN